MDLNRDLADAHIAGDLLIEPANDNPNHNLAFARRKSIEARS
jgi:hypothetical protein